MVPLRSVGLKSTDAGVPIGVERDEPPAARRRTGTQYLAEVHAVARDLISARKLAEGHHFGDAGGVTGCRRRAVLSRRCRLRAQLTPQMPVALGVQRLR